MLKTFRENFRHLQWILWVVIAIFVVFVFVDWGMGTTGRVEGNEIAAQAGSYKITSAEFQKEYKDREEQYRMLYGNGWSPEMLKTLNLPEVVLNTLIDRRILREEGSQLGLSVTDDEVSNKILAMKDREQKSIFVKDGVFVGEGQYRRILSSVGYTPEGFEAQTRDQVLFEKLNRLLMESVFVSDDELQSDFSNRTVKVKIAYLLKANSGPAPAVDDAEAEAHFQKDAAVYSQPEKRKAKYLLVETAKLRGTMNVPETDVAAEYNKNLSKYKKPEEVKARHILYKSDGTPAGEAAAKAKADAALAKLKKGEDFAKLATAESDDPGSKQNGGDLGSFSRGRMVKEFEDAVFAGEVNQLVGPVKTTYGYHIVQVLAKTEERMQPLFEVAPSIRERLKDQRAADEAKRLAQGLADRVAKFGGKLTDDQMKSLATGVVSFNESDFAGRGEPVPGIGFSQPFTKALFTLQKDEASDPITTPRGEVILKVGEIKPPGVPTFQEVKQKVIADVAKKKQAEAAIQTLTEAMANAASLEQIAAKTGDKVETPEAFGKNQPVPGLGLSTALTEAAFAANVGDLRGPIAVSDRGAAVFKLLEKTTFDQAAFDQEKEEIRSSIRSQKGNRVVQALIGKRRAEIRIVVNKDFLKRFEG